MKPSHQRLRGSSSPTKKVVAAHRISTSPPSRRFSAVNDGLEFSDLSELHSRDTITLVTIDLGLHHLPADGFMAPTDLLGDRI
jgi:hypothetical protein